MNKYDIVVIGGGPAGITLAKMLGKKYKMAVIRPEDHSMIYCAMPYAIEGLLKTADTFKSDTLVTEPGAQLIRSAVSGIDFDGKTVELENNDTLQWDKLVIATGAYPFIPPVPGSTLDGVMGFKTEKDLLVIEDLVQKGLEKAVVVGAGAIGIELAQALNFKHVHVDLVDMGESVLPNLVEPDMAVPLNQAVRDLGISLHLKSKVVEIRGDKAAQEVVLENGDVFSLNNDGENLKGIVVFAAGTKPEISLVKDSPLELGRDGIVVNDKMETNIPDVYAVGDVVQFTSGITGEIMPGKLATNAVPMAKVLGFNLLGKERTYPGFYNGAATKVGEHFVGGTGLSEAAAKAAGFDPVVGYSESTTKFPIMPLVKKKKFKLIADRKTHRILGAQIVSGEPVVGRVDIITFAIQQKATVEDLSQLSYASQPHQSFYPAANLLVLASEDIRKQLD